jgi:hypothetical protein
MLHELSRFFCLGGPLATPSLGKFTVITIPVMEVNAMEPKAEKKTYTPPDLTVYMEEDHIKTVQELSARRAQ